MSGEFSRFDRLSKELKELKVPLLEPLEVVDNFEYSGDQGVYTPPFASEYEWWDALLNGSEYNALCTQGDEPIISRGFVQCGGALIRNRDTGLITLVHESQWSTAANSILSLQKKNNLDVIVMNNPIGQMRFEKIARAHKKSLKDVNELFVKDGEEHWAASTMEGGVYRSEPQNHMLHDGSRIKGLTAEQIARMAEESTGDAQGETNLIGEIWLPLPDKSRMKWSLVYRPKENKILIYSHGTKQLFVYPGFEEL